jgi:hypothetical protein
MDEPHEIHGLQVSCRPYRRRAARAEPGDPNFDYEPLANDGAAPQSVALSRQRGRPIFGPLIKVPRELRDVTLVLFIVHRRSVRAEDSCEHGVAGGRAARVQRRRVATSHICTRLRAATAITLPSGLNATSSMALTAL